MATHQEQSAVKQKRKHSDQASDGTQYDKVSVCLAYPVCAVRGGYACASLQCSRSAVAAIARYLSISDLQCACEATFIGNNSLIFVLYVCGVVRRRTSSQRHSIWAQRRVPVVSGSLQLQPQHFLRLCGF